MNSANLGLSLLFIVFGVAAVLLLDAIGSFASRKLKFPYEYLSPVSFSIYVFFSALACGGGNPGIGALCGAVMGFADATVGWWLSVRINPDDSAKESYENSTERQWVVPIVTFFASVAGFVSALIF